jgi:DNA-binding transcriptional LysR family regulator
MLFERHSRGVSLTEAGERLVPYAAEVADVLARARRAALDNGHPRGPLVIGSLETTAGLRLPPILASFARLFPAVDLTLRTGTTSDSIAAVLDRNLEGAFVAGPVEHAELEQEAIFREELVVATAPALSGLAGLHRIEALKTLVLRVGCSYRQRLETVLATRGIVNVRTLEFGSLDAIVGCVAAGIGITLLPRSVMAAASQAGRLALHSLPADEAMIDTLFIRRRDGLVTSTLSAFLQHTRKWATSTSPALAAE